MKSLNRRGRYGYARTGLTLEQLEARQLMAVDLTTASLVEDATAATSHRTTQSSVQTSTSLANRRTSAPTPVASVLADPRSFDGTGNNLANEEWGSVGEQLLRAAANGYADGISTLAGEDRPSARAISNAIAAIDDDAEPNERGLSAFIYVWGQFIDHDIDLTESSVTNPERIPISTPIGDLQFDPDGTGVQVIPFTRSVFDPATGTSVETPREQINQITAWMDGSMIYGSNDDTAARLRTFSGGKLLTSSGKLPPMDEEGFIAGDIRANENIELTSMHALFIREHNSWAAKIARENPRLSDEQIYQRARAIVVAEIQSITYNEFLPALLGQRAVARYRGYDASVNPEIANEFSTAAFRLHTLINDDVEFFGNDGRAVRDEISLREAFFNPDLLQETGIDAILKYAASSQAQEVDNQLVDGLRNFLFGQPGQGGLDLASLNIQRGRDHGLADYNSVREAYGVERVGSFEEITSKHGTRQRCIFYAVFLEDYLKHGSPLTTPIFLDHFNRLQSLVPASASLYQSRLPTFTEMLAEPLGVC